METLATLACLALFFIIFKSAFGPRTYHINVECLPLLAYRVLCESGGSLAEADLVRRFGARIDPQRIRLFQTRAGKARQEIEYLLGTGSVARTDGGVIKVVKPLTFVNTSGAKRFEASLHASGRGMDYRYFSSHDR